jgi:hypothetical protein
MLTVFADQTWTTKVLSREIFCLHNDLWAWPTVCAIKTVALSRVAYRSYVSSERGRFHVLLAILSDAVDIDIK